MNKKILVLFTFALLFAIPLNAAAAASTSGPSNSVMGMPVPRSFTGLTVDTDYDVICTSDGNSTTDLVSDSDGKASVTVTPPEYGQNTYVLTLDGGGAAVVTFSIDNLDIMPYIIVLITVTILFSVIKMFSGGKGGIFG